MESLKAFGAGANQPNRYGCDGGCGGLCSVCVERRASERRLKKQVCRCGHSIAEHSYYAERGCLADTGMDPNRPNPVSCPCERYEAHS